MYDENNKELNYNENYEEVKREEHTPNFVMMDSDSNRSQESSQRVSGSQNSDGHNMSGQGYQAVGNQRQGYQVQQSQMNQNSQGYNWQNSGGAQNGQSYQSNTAQGGSYQNGSGYQSGHSYQNNNYQSSNYQNSSVHQVNSGDSGKKPKKSGSLFRKFVGITAAALLFGVISGGTMVGVNMLADSFVEETYPQVSSQEVLQRVDVRVAGELTGQTGGWSPGSSWPRWPT